MRRVLVVGEPTHANFEVLRSLRSRALHVTVVSRQRAALELLARGEAPHAVLLLDPAPRHADCVEGCPARRGAGGPECFIDCMRSHPGLELLPVMLYASEQGRDPSPDDLAALIAAAAATSGSPERAA